MPSSDDVIILIGTLSQHAR